VQGTVSYPIYLTINHHPPAGFPGGGHGSNSRQLVFPHHPILNMYTGQVTGQQRAKTVVPVGKRINGTRYLVEITLICRETIYIKNYYDSTVDSTLLDLIDDATDLLNNVYNEDFFLYFEMDGLPQNLVDAGVDVCPRGATHQCTQFDCGADCAEHHKNVNRIAEELLLPRWEKNHIVVMWSDVEKSGYYCYGSTETGHPGVGLGVPAITTPYGTGAESIAFWPIIQILSLGNYRTNSAAISLILAHEVAHTLGLQEIYMDAYNDGIEDHGRNGDAVCLMTKLDQKELAYYQAHAALPLCDYCRGKVHDEIDGVDLFEDYQEV